MRDANIHVGSSHRGRQRFVAIAQHDDYVRLNVFECLRHAVGTQAESLGLSTRRVGTQEHVDSRPDGVWILLDLLDRGAELGREVHARDQEPVLQVVSRS